MPFALCAAQVLAEEISVPLGLQAELLAKVAAYDRNLKERSGARVHVLIVQKSGVEESKATAARLERAIGDLDSIGGLPHDEAVWSFAGASELGEECKKRSISLVYLTPGFESEVGAVRDALDGMPIMTVSSVADHVPKGIVVGFDLVSGKPKLLVHLGQARRQKIAFSPRLLERAQVYR